MSADALFRVANLSVLPAWLLLAILPGWRWTQRLVFGLVIGLLSVLYLALVVMFLGEADGGFDSLSGVQRLFQNPYVLLAGWVHYLAFDLFVGSWEVRDARRLRIPHLTVVPCLFLTLMLGPVGWLCYFVLRVGLRRQFEPQV